MPNAHFIEEHQQQPSAFRLLMPSVFDPITSMNITAATAAMTKFISCVEAANSQQENHVSNNAAFPGLFRQNSFGGYDFKNDNTMKNLHNT